MADRSPLAIPIPSDLPGNAGEKRDLHRFFKDLCVELAGVKAENDLLREANGCLQERLAALEDDIQKERKYRQTGRLD